MSARDELDLLLTGTHPVIRGKALDAYRAEVLAEIADLLMQADETAAALLVDRLLEDGAS